MNTLGPRLDPLNLCYFSPTELIALAYEAASDDRWPTFFAELDRSLRQSGSTLVVRGFGLTRYVNLDSPERGFTTLNPSQVFINKGLSRQNFSMAYVGGELVEDWEQLHRLVLGSRGSREPVSAIQIFAAEERTLELEDRVLIRALLPHLQRAIAVYFKTQALQRERDALSACLDAVSDAILLLDDKATVLYSNPSAEACLGESLTHDEGRLRASRTDDDAAFRRCLKEATAGRGADLGAKRLESGETLWFRGLGPDGAILCIARDGRRAAIPPELLVESLGITPAEARVGSLFACGQALPEIADELGISVHTVRQHVKKIQARTGETRQASLLRRILDTVPYILSSPPNARPI